MSLTSDQIANLGLWSYIQFGNEKMMEAALARYQRYLIRKRQTASS